MQRIYENLEEANKIIFSIEHLIKINYNLLKNKGAILRILSELEKAIKKIITSMLHFDYVNKLIRLTNNPEKNLNLFLKVTSKRYGVNEEELILIKEIITIINLKKQSPMAVLKREKLIIFSEQMEKKEIDLKKIEEFLILSKNMLKKAKNSILSKV